MQEVKAEKQTPCADTDDVRNEEPTIGGRCPDDHEIAAAEDTNGYPDHSDLSERCGSPELLIDINTEREYQNDTESNVEQNVGDVKECRFAETEQVRTVD